MADLRPLGSEKLQGMDKINRILEIARYNETPKQEINELATTNYTIKLSDGNTYGIVKEKLGYIIKKGLNESTLDYSDPIRHRKYFRSYSEAMKKLNLMVSEINRVTGHNEEIPLIGEQKFVLKTKKKSVTEPTADSTPPPAEPMAAPTTPPPADDMGMGTDTPPPADDMGMGADAPPPADDMDDDMGMGEPSDEMGDDMNMGGDEGEEPSALKSIQRLTGKLGQKIRAFDKEKGLDSQDIKYVLNSIISALDISNLDEDDKEDVLSKFDEEDEYGMEGPGDLDISDDDSFGMGSEEPSDLGTTEPEPKEGYNTMMDSIFAESSVEKVLSKYFDIKPSEKPILEEKKKRDFLNSKLKSIEMKNEMESMCESQRQLISANKLLKENPNAKFIGKTNKENLVFMVNGKQVKVTERGRIL
jgi:hypothetical protein